MFHEDTSPVHVSHYNRGTRTSPPAAGLAYDYGASPLHLICIGYGREEKQKGFLSIAKAL